MGEPQHVAVADLPDSFGPGDHKKEVDEALDIRHLAMNYYVCRPGQRIPFGYHRHDEQEEIFYVLEGTVAFDTEDGEFRVAADEVFFVPPDTPQRGRAVGDDPARVLAVGAPRDATATTIAEHCPACEETTDREFAVETDDGENVLVLTCAACGAEWDRFGAGPD